MLVGWLLVNPDVKGVPKNVKDLWKLGMLNIAQYGATNMRFLWCFLPTFTASILSAIFAGVWGARQKIWAPLWRQLVHSVHDCEVAYILQYHTILYHTAQHYTTLHYTTLHYAILYIVLMLFYAILHCTIPCYTILDFTITALYTFYAILCTTLYCTILLCTILVLFCPTLVKLHVHYTTLHLTILPYHTLYSKNTACIPSTMESSFWISIL